MFSLEQIKDTLKFVHSSIPIELQRIFIQLAFANQEKLNKSHGVLQQLKYDLHNHSADGVKFLNQAILELNQILVQGMQSSVGGIKIQNFN